MVFRFINNTLWVISHLWTFLCGHDENTPNSNSVKMNDDNESTDNLKLEINLNDSSSKSSLLKYTNNTTSLETNSLTRSISSQTNSKHSSNETLSTINSTNTKNDIFSTNKLINNLLSKNSKNNDLSKITNDKKNDTILSNDSLKEKHKLYDSPTDNSETVLKKSKLINSKFVYNLKLYNLIFLKNYFSENSPKNIKTRHQKSTEKKDELKSSDFYKFYNNNEEQNIDSLKEAKIKKKKIKINEKASPFSPTKDKNYFFNFGKSFFYYLFIEFFFFFLENNDYSKQNELIKPIFLNNKMSKVDDQTVFPIFSGPPPGFEFPINNVNSNESLKPLSSSPLFSFLKKNDNKTNQLNTDVINKFQNNTTNFDKTFNEIKSDNEGNMPEWLDVPVNKIGF